MADKKVFSFHVETLPGGRTIEEFLGANIDISCAEFTLETFVNRVSLSKNPNTGKIVYSFDVYTEHTVPRLSAETLVLLERWVPKEKGLQTMLI